VRCVEAGIGVWSESERALAGINGPYRGMTVVGHLLGKRGEMIRAMCAELGAKSLQLRGAGISSNFRKYTSQRLHFVCEGSEEAISKMQLVLEKHLHAIHEELSEACCEKSCSPGKLKRGPSPEKDLPYDPVHKKARSATPHDEQSAESGRCMSLKEFFASLPESELSEAEMVLREALVEAIKQTTGPSSKTADMFFVAQKDAVKLAKVQVSMPKSVKLTQWIERRIPGDISVSFIDGEVLLRISGDGDVGPPMEKEKGMTEMADNAREFFESLPEELTTEEQQMRQALLDAFSACSESESPLSLVGQDDSVLVAKILLNLPEQVTLSQWIQQRISGDFSLSEDTNSGDYLLSRLNLHEGGAENSTAAFINSLPENKLTKNELALRQHVMRFLEGEPSGRARISAVARDAEVQKAKAGLLPKGMPLMAWIERRIGQEICIVSENDGLWAKLEVWPPQRKSFRQQSTAQLDPPRLPPPPPAPLRTRAGLTSSGHNPYVFEQRMLQ